MRRLAPRLCFACLVVAWLSAAAAGQPISGSALAMKSTGGGVGDWTMDRNGYVGTYITLASPGNVTLSVNAAGTTTDSVAPRMNFVIADTKAGFDVGSGFADYEHTFALPAGTYFVRTEFNNDVPGASRALTVRSLNVAGATVSNSTSTATRNANALEAANTYINNFRKGDVTVALPGLEPGTEVNVSLKRHAFHFGTAVPGVSFSSVNSYLGSGGTVKQTSYQSRLLQNFNAVTPENAGKWSSNEDQRDENPNAFQNGMANVDLMLNFAQANNMQARMHNLIWGDNGGNGQQPFWVLNNLDNGLLDLAAPGNAQAAELRQEISERIDYYVGTGTANDRAHKYFELDVYNESYHTGSNSPPEFVPNYWSVYGASGIADIYNEVKQTVAASGAATKAFVNEYGALGGGDYADWYMRHVEELRNAGIAAGHGDVVDGIGLQYYPSSTSGHVPGNLMQSLQNLAVQGLPLSLTEFGVHNGSGITPTTAANILEDMARLTFGTSDSTGFFMWGFHQESGSGATTLFAPAAALYTVNTSDFNSWTATVAGMRWEDLFSIDADGNANDDWDTELTAVVGPDGAISFDGFWGDYELTINGETFDLALAKGTSQYSLMTVPLVPGDYNLNGTVDAADYVVWRDAEGQTVFAFTGADGNGDTMIDEADYAVWMSNFGAVASGGAAAAAVPEPATLAGVATFFAALLSWRGGGHRRA